VVQGVKWITVDIETEAETETGTESEIEELYGADV